MLPKQTFTPLADRVVLRVIKVNETAGGLTLPDNLAAQGGIETPEAYVVAAGPECKQLKRGQKVIALARVGGSKVVHKGQELFSCREGDILGIVDGEEWKEEPYLEIKDGKKVKA